MDKINGKTIAITGAARSIGHATAKALLTRGARVVIGDRNVDALESAVAGLAPLGSVSGHPLDVTNRESFALFLDKARAEGGGRIDVLINNAGVMPIGPFLDKSERAIRSAIEVNFYGDRVKTDARDAALLARLLHSGQIVAVRVPSVEQESARDLVRAREDCRADLMRTRYRLSKLLLRRGIVYYGGQPWTHVHERWLRRQRFEDTGLRLAYDEAFDALLATRDRRERLDAAITTMAADCEFTPVVRRLGCQRRAATLTAFGLAVEIGEWQRFTGKTIGSYLGLVPTESSSGTSRVQGGLTKTGNGHARRLGRGGVASSQTLSTIDGAAPPLGRRQSGGPRAGRPVIGACTPAGSVSNSAPNARGVQRRDRPRVGWLVLVIGGPR